MKKKIVLTRKERMCIEELGDSIYTPKFIEEFVNRDENVFNNAPVALQIMGCDGYLKAVRNMLKLRKTKSFVVCINSSYIRDAQMFASANKNIAEDDDIYENDKDWIDVSITGYIGIFHAETEEEALALASKSSGYEKAILFAEAF